MICSFKFGFVFFCRNF